ncbi:MAG: ExbD/TolR family protein [Bradymonadaceae bacterium]
MASRFVRKKKPKGLMLTSLLDMFTIILIFLIVSFESEDQDFRLDPDLSLPESSARSIFKPAVNVVINPKQVLVENKPLVPLTDGRFEDDMYQSGEITPLVEELKIHFEQMDFSLPEEDQGIVMIQADKELDYQSLYLVMRSASLAGFSRYRLAIMKK